MIKVNRTVEMGLVEDFYTCPLIYLHKSDYITIIRLYRELDNMNNNRLISHIIMCLLIESNIILYHFL